MTSDPGTFHVRERTRHVRDYHYDDQRPGKPLHLLLPGALIALTSLALIIYILNAVIVKGPELGLSPNQGYPMVLVLAFVYIGGVYLFSYGYELYDTRKALRLTAIIVFTTFMSVVIIAVVFLLISAASESSSGGSSSSGSSSSRSGGASKGAGAWLGGWFGGSRHSSSGASSGGSSSSSSSGGVLDINLPTRTVEKKVVEEVKVPVAPRAITCPSCGRSYIPFDTQFACPACGTPTPPDLVEASRAGDSDQGGGSAGSAPAGDPT